MARNILAKGLGLTIKRTAATATAESRLTNGRATFQVWLVGWVLCYLSNNLGEEENNLEEEESCH